MNCCTANDSVEKDTFFSKRSRRYAKQFRKKGLDKPQKLLLEGILQANDVTSKTLLEVGCGAAGLLLTLLQRGAIKATGVDAAYGMLENAKIFATELKQDANIQFIHGDFSEHANSVPPSDITILDKVLCCDANPEKLIQETTAKTKNVYAVSFPRDGVIARMFFTSGIAIAKLFRLRFTPFYHEPSNLLGWIKGQRFQIVYTNKTIIWQIAVFKRIITN